MYDENRLWRRVGNHHGSSDYGHVLDGSILAVCFAAYLVNRCIGAGGFFRNHFDDVVAGVVLLAWANFLPRTGTPAKRYVSSFRGALLVTAFAAVVWEGIVPVVLPHRVADPLDVLSYFAGAVAYLAFSHLLRTSRFQVR